MHLTVNCEFNIGEIMHLVCLEAKKRGDNNTSMFVNKKMGR